jgi:hypothetical protein
MWIKYNSSTFDTPGWYFVSLQPKYGFPRITAIGWWDSFYGWSINSKAASRISHIMKIELPELESTDL